MGDGNKAGLWAALKRPSAKYSLLTLLVVGFFSGIVDSAKNLLGIHSPSTVFAGIGENMGAGIGVGFAHGVGEELAADGDGVVAGGLGQLLGGQNGDGRLLFHRRVPIPRRIFHQHRQRYEGSQDEQVSRQHPRPARRY